MCKKVFIFLTGLNDAMMCNIYVDLTSPFKKLRRESINFPDLCSKCTRLTCAHAFSPASVSIISIGAVAQIFLQTERNASLQLISFQRPSL